jgi:hypothetical protein
MAPGIGEARTFRRTLGMRLLSIACALLFGSLEADHLATGGRLISLGGVVLGLLFLVSLGASLLNMGDRYRIDDEGIGYANPLLARLGVRLDRRIAWREVVSVRAHRPWSHGAREEKPGALFLHLASGRRFVIDSVEDFDEVRRLVATHVVGSGAAGGG